MKLCGLEVLELKGEDLCEEVGVCSPGKLLPTSRALTSSLGDLVTESGEGLDRDLGAAAGEGLPTDIAPILVIISRLDALGTEIKFFVNQRSLNPCKLRYHTLNHHTLDNMGHNLNKYQIGKGVDK